MDFFSTPQSWANVPVRCNGLLFAVLLFGPVQRGGYVAAVSGKLVNRGFLNGSVRPIYGFGVVAVLWS